MTAFLIHNMAPLMFAALIVVMLMGYPVAFALAAVGIALRAPRHRARPPAGDAVPGAAGAGLGRDVERHAARDPVLHVHGADPRAQRHGRGPARDHRPAVRAGARRPRVCGDLRRRAAGGDDGRGRRVGHLDGPHLAADHAALRLRPALRVGRDRRIGHARADHSAVARADHHGRPARQVRRRHVRRRVHPGLRADRRCTRPTRSACARSSQAWAPALPAEARTLKEPDGSERHAVAARAVRHLGHRRRGVRQVLLPAGRAARRGHRRRDVRRHRRRVLRSADRQDAEAPGAVEARRARRVRADSRARADLPRARHDLPRRCDADRRRRDGRDRRADHGARPAASLVEAASSQAHGHDGASSPRSSCSSSSARACSASRSTASTATSGSRSC